MKNENEIKRAFAMEVIEKLKELDRNEIGGGEWNKCYKRCIIEVQSILPKEEEVDWSKASEDKRLRHGVINYAQYVSHYVGLNGDVCAIDEYNKTVVLYSKSSNKWAEIETKTESDEVKAGGIDRTPRYVRAFNPSHHEVEDVYFTGGTCDENEFIMQGAGGYFFTIGAFSEIEPTLEQKARKKAEEMYYKIESSQEAIYQALLIDPKTL